MSSWGLENQHQIGYIPMPFIASTFSSLASFPSILVSSIEGEMLEKGVEEILEELDVLRSLFDKVCTFMKKQNSTDSFFLPDYNVIHDADYILK